MCDARPELELPEALVHALEQVLFRERNALAQLVDVHVPVDSVVVTARTSVQADGAGQRRLRVRGRLRRHQQEGENRERNRTSRDEQIS